MERDGVAAPVAGSLLGYLDREGPTHVPDIAADLDRSPVDIDQCCFSLREERYVRSLGWGEYEITDRGRHYLRDSVAPDD